MTTETYSDHPVTPLREGWHAVALSRDVPVGQPLPVILGGREIVVWRGESGAVRAWVDRCPHRGMRLSFGFVRGDTLSCLYHGWRYRLDGGCEHIPAHPDLVPPKTITADAYPTAEAAGLVWLRIGAGTEAPDAPAGDWQGAASVTIDIAADALCAGLALPTGFHAEVQPVVENRCRVHVIAPYGRLKEAAAFAAQLRHQVETQSLLAAE